MLHNSARRAFSLLETTIGMAILGIGLIMVAALFPVALTQHRDSVDRARSLELVPQAVAMVHKRMNPDLLWYNAPLLSQGFDSPWNVMPLSNIDAAGRWSFDPANPNNSSFSAGYDYMLNYTDAINGAPLFSVHQVYANDILSDREFPLSDRQANESANRLVWYGFHRKLATGANLYAAAICKQRRDQIFAMQDLSGASALVDPVPIADRPQRFPVPWRVTVSRVAGTNALYINNPSPAANSLTLADLAPVAAKIMVRGVPDSLPPTVPVPAGQVLTVSETLTNGTVLVRENIDKIVSDVDVWVFPPSMSGPGLSKEAPVLEWKVGL
ncbi:MAG: type II secretion system protein [Phycisphaerae bacterium]|nr:type II secretion system protein [Phycisphaerae bacterium]